MQCLLQFQCLANTLLFPIYCSALVAHAHYLFFVKSNFARNYALSRSLAPPAHAFANNAYRRIVKTATVVQKRGGCSSIHNLDQKVKNKSRVFIVLFISKVVIFLRKTVPTPRSIRGTAPVLVNVNVARSQGSPRTPTQPLKTNSGTKASARAALDA